MDTPILFSILTNEDLHNHFIDFGVEKFDGLNNYRLSDDGYEQLQKITKAGFKLDYCLVGECERIDNVPAKWLRGQEERRRLAEYPADLRRAMYDPTTNRNWRVPLTPILQSAGAIVVNLANTTHSVRGLANTLGYADAESIYERMLSLYPVEYGGVDKRLLKKGKIGEKARKKLFKSAKKIGSNPQIFKYENKLWITCPASFENNWMQLSRTKYVAIGEPSRYCYFFFSNCGFRG